MIYILATNVAIIEHDKTHHNFNLRTTLLVLYICFYCLKEEFFVMDYYFRNIKMLLIQQEGASSYLKLLIVWRISFGKRTNSMNKVT